ILNHNVAKDLLLVGTLLDCCSSNYDVLFIQEPLWGVIRSVPSTTDKSRDDVIGSLIHPRWIHMVRPPDFHAPGHCPRVMAYVLKRLEHMRPSMRRDIVDYHNMLLLSLFEKGGKSYNLLNVYSDDRRTAINYLDEHSIDFPNLCYMGGDFNPIEWDPEVSALGGAAAKLEEFAASVGLEYTPPSNPGPTFYPHNPELRSSVLDLMF
ncbi:hypothetical protein CPB83DRAFT_740682, partial [Crepidotus variabilis]